MEIHDYNAMQNEIKVILIVIFIHTIIYVFVAFVHIDTYKNLQGLIVLSDKWSKENIKFGIMNDVVLQTPRMDV